MLSQFLWNPEYIRNNKKLDILYSKKETLLTQKITCSPTYINLLTALTDRKIENTVFVRNIIKMLYLPIYMRSVITIIYSLLCVRKTLSCKEQLTIDAVFTKH